MEGGLYVSLAGSMAVRQDISVEHERTQVVENHILP